jgi:hypothetical protein
MTPDPAYIAFLAQAAADALAALRAPDAELARERAEIAAWRRGEGRKP